MYRKYIKRALDFILSIIAIIVFSPVFLIVAILVRIKLGAPIFFKQERPGKDEKIFTLFKFRTMTNQLDKNGEPLSDELRLTKFGKFLRSTSLDELPELINILKGDMSIIGPRPLLVQYLPLYNEHQRRRHKVRPGLSGLAQVSGRNTLSWESRFILDVEYVENIKFISDFKIILLTLKKVLVREGINSDTAATMEYFEGNKMENIKMNDINVLLLSVGRRVELIQCFKRASKKLNITSRIVAGDCSNTAPALYFADSHYLLPRINDQNYIESIINICNRENISLIVPTIDTELLLLAENKNIIEKNTGAKVLISDLHVIEICRDKLKTQQFLEENNFNVPKMYTEDDLDNDNNEYPLFIKPRSGSSSINAFKVNNKDEFNLYKQIIDKPMVQEFMEGKEYTVDIFLDFYSNIITIVPRLRISTRSGEISKGKIIKDRDIIDDVTRLMKILKPIGHITVQLMKTDNGIKYIEINPRFGGGAPMSIRTGADSCENLFRLLIGQKLEYNENYRDNLLFLRFDNSICLDENLEIIE